MQSLIELTPVIQCALLSVADIECEGVNTGAFATHFQLAFRFRVIWNIKLFNVLQ